MQTNSLFRLKYVPEQFVKNYLRYEAVCAGPMLSYTQRILNARGYGLTVEIPPVRLPDDAYTITRAMLCDHFGKDCVKGISQSAYQWCFFIITDPSPSSL